MPRPVVVIGVIAVWLIATVAVALAVVEWRDDDNPQVAVTETGDPTPDFFCQSTTEAYLGAVGSDTPAVRVKYLYDAYLDACAEYDPDPSPRVPDPTIGPDFYPIPTPQRTPPLND